VVSGETLFSIEDKNDAGWGWPCLKTPIEKLVNHQDQSHGM
jgi:peptide methionine sulfoxide reductase MsrB